MPITTVTTAAYLGMLFQMNKRPNAMLKLAGRFGGQSVGEEFAYKATTSREFPTGVFYQLPAPSQPAVLEGANAPAPTTTSLSQATNVIQLFQETCSVTYLAELDNTISGIVPIPTGEANGTPQNPRNMTFQIVTKLQKIAQDANFSFLRGVFANPADPSAAALKTRGVLTAVTSNVNDTSGGAAPNAAGYRAAIDALLSQMITHNGYAIDETMLVFADATQFQNTAHAYQALGTVFLTPYTDVAGLQIRKVQSTFGTMLLVLEPDMPANTLLFVKMDEIGIVGLNVPKKGVVFEEPLFKQGSADQTQIYGQMGIDHGPEYYHGAVVFPAGTAIGG